jgi:ribosomal protein S18 acetylase RimI-like enzyme
MIEWERQVLERLTLPSRFAIVTHQNKASGYGRSVLHGSALHIEDLWILPTLRSQGLGTRLINGLLHLGFEDGANTAYLTVNESNAGARRLYERLGFVNHHLYYYLAQKE